MLQTIYFYFSQDFIEHLAFVADPFFVLVLCSLFFVLIIAAYLIENVLLVRDIPTVMCIPRDHFFLNKPSDQALILCDTSFEQ
jgi:hypothetical protein